MNTKSNKKAYFFGFSRWKHAFIHPFFPEYSKENLIFINPLLRTHYDLALKKGLDCRSDIYIWGKKSFLEVEEFALNNSLNIYRVEDGFIRSVGLGSDLTQPYSQVIDSRGIYFDPTHESDLEYYLNHYDFVKNKTLLKRALRLKEEIIKNKISKYNADAIQKLVFPQDKVVALVVGQVEDDASIRYGAPSMTNMKLLQEVRKKYPEHYLVFKPHPDVLSGNRIGDIDKEEALRYCNEIIQDISISDVLQAVDEVHTMTSLSGFEGLLYEKKVFTYGLPFYAGWGLTNDNIACERRQRDLKLEELIAATYFLYPRYINPLSKEICEPEIVVKALKTQRDLLANSFFLRTKSKIYSYLSRIIQKLLSLVG
jgi:capsular polysaccharide export protein